MSVKALDKLGLAIVDAGYDWTPEMRKAYENGVRESKWVGLTEDEKQFFKVMGFSGIDIVEAKLKEKNT